MLYSPSFFLPFQILIPSYCILFNRIVCLMIDYAYLSPPPKAYRTKLKPSYIYQYVNGRHIRRIFTRPIYQPFERQAIETLREYLKKKAPNIHYPEELLLRFNYAGHFKLPQTTERVKLYDQWHQNQLVSTLNKVGREILQFGHLYAFGRDYDYCPIVVVRPARFDLKKYEQGNYCNAVAGLLAPLEKYMLVGGVIEKWNVMVDLQGKKVVGNIELVTRVANRILNAYPYRIKRLLFLNVPQNLPIVTQVTDLVKKYDQDIHVDIVKKMDDLTDFISVEQRQAKYGGAMQNLCEYWPIHTTNKYEETESNSGHTEYESVINDPAFFEEPKPPICDCSNSKCIIY